MPENLTQYADALNTLSAFLGTRDVPELTLENLGGEPLDVLILFGGSTLAGDSVFHEAMANHVAKHYLIAGGHGHTTASLRGHLSDRGFDFLGDPSEATMHQRYLEYTYVDHISLLEEKATNCGNNVTNALELLGEHAIFPKRVGIIQDATMQRRMAAVFAKVAPDIQVTNFAAYQATAQIWNGQLGFTKPLFGMWTMPEYVSLVMNEIPRLTDDAQGYGPNGQNFIAHVDLPADVTAAYDLLKSHFDVALRPMTPTPAEN